MSGGGGGGGKGSKNSVASRSVKKWPIFAAAYCIIVGNTAISMPALAGKEKSGYLGQNG